MPWPAMRHFLRHSSIFGLCAAASACFTGTPSPPAGVSPGSSDGGTAGQGGPFPSAGTVTLAADAGTAIAPLAFGQNYWNWVDFGKTGVTGLTGTETLVSALHLNVLRSGGNNNDSNSPSLFDSTEIDKFIAYCHAVGAEPILQVPLLANNVDGGAASAQAAADMVTYVNGTKGYGVKYWEIGNEPDLYAPARNAQPPISTASDYCAQFSTYAAAMKAANTAATSGGLTIRLLGPELAYRYTSSSDWLTPFLDGCKEYVDIVSVHRYPFMGSATSISGALNDVDAFKTTVQSLAAIVATHARPGTPLAITEANISFDYAPSAYTAASQVAQPGTFYAGMWTADVMGAALESHLWSLALWNLGEASAVGSVLGYITAGMPTPAYYAERMVSANLRGDILAPEGVPSGFSIYASHDSSAGMTTVLVLNKTTNGGAVSFDVGGGAAKSFEFPAISVSLVQLPDATGSAARLIRYTADLAAASMPPQLVP